MQKHARKIRKQRAERLSKMKQKNHQTNDSQQNRENTPRYQRSKKLKTDRVSTQEYVVDQEVPTTSKTRPRYVVKNTVNAITHQPYLRAKRLKKPLQNNFNQKLQQNIDQRQQRKERIEQELK